MVPARGGSKGLPGKNIAPLCGKPLITYTFESAKGCNRIDRLIVSTDDPAIASVAERSAVVVPFLRPPHLATDRSLSIDVIRHALEFQENLEGKNYDFVVMLQPTTPLKTSEDIDAAIEKLLESGCDSVVTMVNVGAHHPARMYRIEEDRLVGVMDEGITMRPRQELPDIYIRNGAVYACRRDVLYRHNSLLGPDTRPVVMPPERSVNIDGPIDLVLAEHYLRIAGRC